MKKDKYELTDDQFAELVARVNRSGSQSNRLFNLLSGDFEKLKQLEAQIMNCFVHYCPLDLEEINTVMGLQPKSDWFKWE